MTPGGCLTHKSVERDAKPKMNEQKLIEKEQSRVGRPTKRNKKTIERLRAALSDGLSIKSACCVAGIGVTTLAEWRDQDPSLEEHINEAKEIARQKALHAIKTAGKKNWRAHAEWLKLAFPADYRGTANRIEVSASALAVCGPVITEEERLRYIRQRDQALLANSS